MTSNPKTPPIGAVLTAESDWIEWHGGENPVPGQMVEVEYRDGNGETHMFSDELRWDHPCNDDDIIAYRVVPSQAQEPSVPAGEGEEGNHDCLAKRRPGEPMFILLGRDPDAGHIVRTWAGRRLAAGGDPEHCQMGLDTAARMDAYSADPANRPASAPDASAYPAPEASGAGGWPSREEVARVLDLAAVVADLEYEGSKSGGAIRARDLRERREDAFDKADRILALFAPLPAAPVQADSTEGVGA